MVEYAIVLACIAAVGVAYYAFNKDAGEKSNTLSGILNVLWKKISGSAGTAAGVQQGS